MASIFHVCSPLLEMHAAGHPHPIHHPPQDVSFLFFSLCVFYFLYFVVVVILCCIFFELSTPTYLSGGGEGEYWWGGGGRRERRLSLTFFLLRFVCLFYRPVCCCCCFDFLISALLTCFVFFLSILFPFCHSVPTDEMAPARCSTRRSSK